MKNKNIGCWLLLAGSSSVCAMQPLDDQSLAAATGQNGLTLGIQADQVKFNQVAEPYRVCRRVNILRDYPDDKTKLYPRN